MARAKSGSLGEVIKNPLGNEKNGYHIFRKQ